MSKFGDHGQEILPRYWLGDAFGGQAAFDAGFYCFCCLEQPYPYPGLAPDNVQRAIHTPIILEQKGGQIVAVTARLNEAVTRIFVAWNNHRNEVFVHCAAGMERSPLTTVWFLRHFFAIPLDRGYDWVIAHWPQAADRQSWLEK